MFIHVDQCLEVDEMRPFNPETRAKFATMMNMKKEGYQEGLLEIEEKHQNHHCKLCPRLWIVGPHLVRFEVCRFVCPIKEHSVPAGRNLSNLYSISKHMVLKIFLPNRFLEVMAATLPGHGA